MKVKKKFIGLHFFPGLSAANTGATKETSGQNIRSRITDLKKKAPKRELFYVLQIVVEHDLLHVTAGQCDRLFAR